MAANALSSTDAKPPRFLILLLAAMAALSPLSIDMYLPGLPMLIDEFELPSRRARLRFPCSWSAWPPGSWSTVRFRIAMVGGRSCSQALPYTLSPAPDAP